MTIDILFIEIKNKAKEIDINTIQECIDDGIDINETDNSGWSLLLWLFQRKETENSLLTLRILLDQGIDPIYINNKQENFPVLREVLKKKKHKFFLRVLAKFKEDIDVGSSLYDIDICGKPLLFFVIQYGCLESFKILIEEQGNESCLEREYGEESALFYAIRNNSKVAYYLLDEGADPREKNRNHQSVLHFLILYSESKDIIEFVQKFELDDDDFTAVDGTQDNSLHYIAKSSDSELLAWLVDEKKYDFDFDTKNFSGNTPLHIVILKLGEVACEDELNSCLSLIKILLKKGASVLTANEDDETVLSLLKDLNRHEVIGEQCIKSLKDMFEVHGEIERRKKELEQLADQIKKEDPEVVNYLITMKEFIKSKYICNADLESDRSGDLTSSLPPLEEILESIRCKTVLSYSYVRFYELVSSFIQNEDDLRLQIYERFDKKHLQNLLHVNQYHYTFLGDKLYRLSEVNITDVHQNNPLFKLMTTLVYKAQRYSWEHESCQLHFKLIIKIEPKYSSFNLEEFIAEIKIIEKNERDYYGENLSDNSDSDDESKYQVLSHRKKSLTYSYTSVLFKRAQPEVIFTKAGEFRSTNGLPYNRDARQQVFHSEPLDLQMTRDLEQLNNLAVSGELNAETIKKISTPFVIAQYRGICYRSDDWDKITRGLHRKEREEGACQFSRAVLSHGGYSTYRNYLEEKIEHKETHEAKEVKLINFAIQLQDQLLQLASSGPVKIKFNESVKTESYLYDNALLALQDFYTKSYKGFHQLLGTFHENFLAPNVQNSSRPKNIKTLEHAILLSIQNKLNPFISTSDTPEHSLRYAYGEKFYKDLKNLKLQPRWRKSGLAERPYSGKVYVSLHGPVELITESNHLVSLNEAGKVHINIEIIPERETTFFSYIPNGKVIGHHVAKFPSFHTPYKEIYFEKYGLNKERYEKFQGEMRKTAPHSPERDRIMNLLFNHLVSYNEVCLIEEARVAAQSSKAILIYRNAGGGFSLLPCKAKEISISNDKKRKSASEASYSQIQKKRADRKGDALQSSGFLPDLFHDFQILTTPSDKISLLAALEKLTAISYDKLKDMYENFDKKSRYNFFERPKPEYIIEKFSMDYNFLRMIATNNSLTIILHNPELNKGNEIRCTGVPQKEIHLYYMGGEKYSALRSIIQSDSLALKESETEESKSKMTTKIRRS